MRNIDPNLFIRKIVEEGTLHRFTFMEMLNTKNITLNIQSLMKEFISIECTTCHHLYTLTLNDFLLSRKECVCFADNIHNITPIQNKHLYVSTVTVLFEKPQL